MKKVVANFIRTFGCETGYSGNTRTLYIKGVRATEARQATRNKWPALAFALKITDEIPEEAKEIVPIVSEKINDNPSALTGFGLSDLSAETALTEVSSKDAAIILREKIDAYLIDNPIDRNAKAPYLHVAELFKVKNDYVRGRWRALRKKGLVEKELSNTSN